VERLPDLDGIQSFLLVAENLSFRRAASRLNLDQSALSRRIKELETRLGVALLQRTTREVRLTEAGQAFYEANLQLVDTLRDTISLAQRTARGSTGRLRVGYMSFAGIAAMPEPVRRYRDAYPGVTVELLYFRTQAQKIELARHGLDVGFLIGPFEHADFQTSTVLEERLVALLPSDHPLAARRSVTMADLSATALVLGTVAQWDFYRTLLQDLFEARALTLDVAFEASSTMGILGLVAAGLGATIYPAGIRRLQPAGISIVDIEDCDMLVQTALAWRRDGVSAAARNFLAICGASAYTSGHKE
jgi:DNA-binding transcriptional LysR family regulator